MQIVAPWSIKITHEFHGPNTEDGERMEDMLKRRYFLMRNETDMICEMKQGELLQLQKWLTAFVLPRQLYASSKKV